ncbi:MAG: general secretion pathway protein G [Planctomycetota bacterium]|jgi:general secretion pathway protein G
MKATQNPIRRGGFTLVELVVVMLIVSVMAGVVVPVASKVFDRGARKATSAEMQAVAEAVRLYFLDTVSLPVTASALSTDPGGVLGWSGPYLSGGVGNGSGSATDFDLDGWREPYQVSAAGDVWSLTSSGPDRTRNTVDDIVIDVDITSERRSVTDERLAVINLAIRLYNEDWLSPPPPVSADPLSDIWSTAFAQLVSRGYLSNAVIYLTDGWGDSFVRIGSSGPVVSVTSLNTGF